MIAIDLIVGCVIGVTFLASYIWAAVALNFVKKHSKELIACFEKSTLLRSTAPSTQDGILMKLRFFGTFAASITFPKRHIKRGVLNQEDLDNLPAPLRRALAVMLWIQLALIGCMATAFVMIKTGVVQ